MSAQVVVTGASKGLGRALVDVLVDRGWTVWATDVSPDVLDLAGAQHAVVMDVSDPKSVVEVMGRVRSNGGIDALVNNAGIFPLQGWKELTADTMHRVYGVNVVGPMLCAQEAAKSMIERDVRGSIVNIVSLAFYKGHATGIAYAASKGGLIGVTRSLARALGPHGIRVNAVAPGLMVTDGIRALVEQGDFPSSRLAGEDPDRELPGITEPALVAETVAMLLGTDAAETTGQVINADGGSYFV